MDVVSAYGEVRGTRFMELITVDKDAFASLEGSASFRQFLILICTVA